MILSFGSLDQCYVPDWLSHGSNCSRNVESTTVFSVLAERRGLQSSLDARARASTRRSNSPPRHLLLVRDAPDNQRNLAGTLIGGLPSPMTYIAKVLCNAPPAITALGTTDDMDNDAPPTVLRSADSTVPVMDTLTVKTRRHQATHAFCSRAVEKHATARIIVMRG